MQSLKMRTGLVIEILERHIETGYLTGAVALIGRGTHAEVVAVGDQSRETPGLMQRDSLFRITSMTKPITAVVTLMLVDDGQLRLTERIDHWLPELAQPRVLRNPSGPLDDTVPAKRPITVEDLLTFRCGLGFVPTAGADSPLGRRIAELRLLGFGPPDPASPLGPDEWLRRLGTLPLVAQPGETWLYNTGSDILGVLIARVARKPLPLLLAERLMPVEPTPLSDAPQRPAQATRSRLALHHPVPLPGTPPVVGEPQEGERPRSGTRAVSSPGRPRRRLREGNELGFVWMDCQSVLAESLRQNLPHPPGIPRIGEADDEVVRVANEIGPSTQAWLDHLLEPLVQHVVQEDV